MNYNIIKDGEIPFESAIMGNDKAYKSYLIGMINELNNSIGKGYDVIIPGPMESRIFLDFLNEALRRFYENDTKKD